MSLKLPELSLSAEGILLRLPFLQLLSSRHNLFNDLIEIGYPDK